MKSKIIGTPILVSSGTGLMVSWTIGISSPLRIAGPPCSLSEAQDWHTPSTSPRWIARWTGGVEG